MLKLTPAALRAPTLSIASDKEGEDFFDFLPFLLLFTLFTAQQ
jgi:hypothetical protein